MGYGASTLALAVFSGTLLALSFPRYGHPAFAWIGLVPLLLAVVRTASAPRAFSLGFVAGVIYFGGTLYWIIEVMANYGGLARPVAWLVHSLLLVYLALFPALFAVTVAYLYRRLGPTGLLYAPAVWVTTELGRLHLFTGFPWELLGYSQSSVLPIAQVASLAGVLGISGLVALVNTAIAHGIMSQRRRWEPVGVAAIVVLASIAFGGWRLRDASLVRAGTPLRVAALQGNIAQHDKWKPVLRDTILRHYLELTRRAAGDGAKLIVWPEAATPFSFENDVTRGEVIRALARETGTYLLIGSTYVTSDAELRYYNTASMVDPSGETTGVYRKQHLVPFGEYVPLRRALFFVSPLVETVADFSPGSGPRTLPVEGQPVSAAICYEIIYPGLVRDLVVSGSRLLTTITNDAWYGRSSAPYQHFQQATMRAIEQGRFLVRAANTGISGIVDPYGRVLARTPLFETAVVVDDVRLLAGRTFYGRIGDLPAYTCAVLTAFVVWASRRRVRRVGSAGVT